MQGADNGPVKAASAVCDGRKACSGAKGFTLSGAFQCKGPREACNRMGPVKAASAVCDGNYACSRAKGFTLSGDFQCKGAREACDRLGPVKAASAVCDGKYACSGAKGFTLSGDFQCKGASEACDRMGPVKAASAVCGNYACSGAKGFTLSGDLQCKGKKACNAMGTVTAVTALCVGPDACYEAKSFTLTGNMQCLEQACNSLGSLTVGGSFITTKNIPNVFWPSGTSLLVTCTGPYCGTLTRRMGKVEKSFNSVGNKLLAASFIGFGTQSPIKAACASTEGATSKWWYCLGTKTCVEEATKCGGLPTQRPDRAIELHNPHTNKVSAMINMTVLGLGQDFKKTYEYMAFGEVRELKLERKVMAVLGSGHQQFAAKMMGVVRFIGGTVTDIDLTKTESLPREPLPYAYHPNHDSTFLVPVLSELKAQSSGAFLTPPVLTLAALLLSIGSLTHVLSLTTHMHKQPYGRLSLHYWRCRSE